MVLRWARRDPNRHPAVTYPFRLPGSLRYSGLSGNLEKWSSLLPTRGLLVLPPHGQHPGLVKGPAGYLQLQGKPVRGEPAKRGQGGVAAQVKEDGAGSQEGVDAAHLLLSAVNIQPAGLVFSEGWLGGGRWMPCRVRTFKTRLTNPGLCHLRPVSGQ